MISQGKVGENSGFTLVELVLIITLLAIVSIAVSVKWPSDMSAQAAKLEFRQAIRFAQHMALTRRWSTSAEAWAITVAANKYYIGRVNAGCQVSCNNSECAEEAMCNRSLLGDPTSTIVPATATLLFNGLGEPIDATGVLLGNTTFTINGTEYLTVCAETGYVLEGNSCP
jgi:type II secretory pathway pseudopilin PulG